jgi:hypothetical protein
MSNEPSPEERLAADLAADDAECAWCQRAPGLVLLAAAGLMAYIGTDILTSGWLTRTLAGAPAVVAATVVTSASTAAAGEAVSPGDQS